MVDFTVEYASFNSDGTRVSASQKRKACQAESSLLKKIYRTLEQQREMERLLCETRAALPAFDEVQLVLRNKHSSCRKRLRVQGLDPEQFAFPTFFDCCARCKHGVFLSDAHIILCNRQLLWVCVPCLPNQERVKAKAALAALRKDIEIGLLDLFQRFDETGDSEPRAAVLELIEVVNVLKASARKPLDEEPATSNENRIKGLERDAWSLVLNTKLPDFPNDILGQCLVCDSMSKSERDGLAHLHKRLKDAHNRIFLTDLGTLIKDSVTRRNSFLANRYKGTFVERFKTNDAISQWLAQKGLCSSCGEALLWSRLKGGAQNFPELDRSDIRIHTYQNNCTWMCHHCNTTKGRIFDLREYDRALLETIRGVQAVADEQPLQVLGMLHIEIDRQKSRHGFMCKKI
jgi:hypothetical protein